MPYLALVACHSSNWATALFMQLIHAVLGVANLFCLFLFTYRHSLFFMFFKNGVTLLLFI